MPQHCPSAHPPTALFVHRIIVAGDGRYYNSEAMPIICRMLAANGVSNIWLPAGGGIMTTPAVSAAIRASPQCLGAVVLTASHNPGGPGEDFGIKYNLEYGQPAGEDFTDEVRLDFSGWNYCDCSGRFQLTIGLCVRTHIFLSYWIDIRTKPRAGIIQDC